MTPAEKTLARRMAAHMSWAKTSDPKARTQPARDKFDQRFEDEVDPDRTLPPAERERRAASARSAYFSRLALKSAQARSSKNEKRPAEAGPSPNQTPTPTPSLSLPSEEERIVHESTRSTA